MKQKSNNYAKIYIFLLSVLFLVGFALGDLIAGVNSDLAETNNKAIEEVVMLQQRTLLSEFEKQKENLVGLSTAISNLGYNQEETINYFNSIKDTLGYENIAIVDTNGKGVSTSRDTIIDASALEPFKTALEGRVETTKPYISYETNKYVVSVSAPIYYQNEVHGVIMAEYGIGYMYTMLSTTVNEEWYALVIDENMNVILNTYDTSIVDCFSNGDIGVQAINDIKNSVVGSSVFSFDNQNMIISYRPLDMNDWTVVYLVEEEAVLKNAIEISNRIMIVSFSIVIVLFLFIAIVLINNRKNVKAIKNIAYNDDLTGIRNLTKFKLDVRKILDKDRIQKYYLVKGDVVNFKSVNQLYNYEIGNHVIKTIAEVGKSIESKNFIQARVSGDEFIMFSDESFFGNMEKASEIYEKRFMEALEFAQTHKFQFRLGRYLIEDNSADIDEMLNKVNLAHSMAKGEGRNLVWDYDEAFKNEVIRVTEITNKMEKALQNLEFKLYLQPKNDIITGKIVGAEALVRWIETSGNMIYPNDFIPVFEKNGFIEKLDMYMLERVCEFQAKWKDKECVPISVNFSRINFLDPDFVTKISYLVKQYNIDHELIEVEVTETIISEDKKQLENVLDQLKENKFTVAIDDFGAGYSSLGMLKNFEVNTLKLDRSFFVEDEGGRGDQVIDVIIQLAHKLNMDTVAEGVETEEQLNLLKSIGCNAAQGYYFAKPMPASEFEKMLFGES